MSNKQKILFISPFFFPEPISTGKFNTELAVGLSKKGHDVSVLCFHPFYPNWRIKKTQLTLNNINIIRGGKSLKFTNNTFLRRIILELSFAFFILRKLNILLKQDIIIPVFPPSFAFFICKSFISKKTTIVGMIHDLQEIYSSQKKSIFFNLIGKIISYVEKKSYNSCQRLIFLSEEMKEEAIKLYGLNNINLKTQYPFFNISKENKNNLGNIITNDTVNIVYSGALSDKQNPKELYRFFDYASKKIKNSMFYFFSQGKEFEKLMKFNKNSNIKFHPLVDKENLFELYQKSSVQIIPQKRNTSKGSLPSKLPNLIYSGCKVLLITDRQSEIEKLFIKNNLGKIGNDWDSKLLTDELVSLLNEKQNKVKLNEFAHNNFSLEEFLKKIINF